MFCVSELYFRFRFWSSDRHRHVILHRCAKSLPCWILPKVWFLTPMTLTWQGSSAHQMWPNIFIDVQGMAAKSKSKMAAAVFLNFQTCYFRHPGTVVWPTSADQIWCKSAKKWLRVICLCISKGRLKMREWKMRYGQNCKGGKCRSGKCRSR